MKSLQSASGSLENNTKFIFGNDILKTNEKTEAEAKTEVTNEFHGELKEEGMEEAEMKEEIQGGWREKMKISNFDELNHADQITILRSFIPRHEMTHNKTKEINGEFIESITSRVFSPVARNLMGEVMKEKDILIYIKKGLESSNEDVQKEAIRILACYKDWEDAILFLSSINITNKNDFEGMDTWNSGNFRYKSKQRRSWPKSSSTPWPSRDVPWSKVYTWFKENKTK